MTLELEGPELEQYILRKSVDDLGIQLSSVEDDFFTAGMDSLKSIQARDLLLEELSMGGNVRNLSQNVVFESSNVVGLTKKLCGLRRGEEVTDKEDVFEVMRNTIEKYSNFEPHSPGKSTLEKKVVVRILRFFTCVNVDTIYRFLPGPGAPWALIFSDSFYLMVRSINSIV